MVVALNEVCRGQVNALLGRLNYLGWPYNGGDFHPTVVSTGLSCPPVGGVKEFGNGAVWRATTAISPERRYLRNPTGSELRGITCLRMITSVSPQSQAFCYTHISNNSADHYDQTYDVAVLAKSFHNAGYDTVLAGDLNQTPANPNLNRLYQPAYGAPQAHGQWNEVGAHVGGSWVCCVKTGASTFDGGGKIDYIFTGVGDWAPQTVSVGGSAYSDHKVLSAYVNY